MMTVAKTKNKKQNSHMLIFSQSKHTDCNEPVRNELPESIARKLETDARRGTRYHRCHLWENVTSVESAGKHMVSYDWFAFAPK